MNKRVLIIGFAVMMVISGFAVVSGFSQDEVQFVRDSAFGVRVRGMVPFVHDEHNAKAGTEDCTLCHHVFEEGKKSDSDSSEDMECSECHMAGGKDRMDLMRAYHLNCKGCHEERKAGPVMCGECHLEK